ncbi:hypothetical protein FIBSPDRAFT_1009032 [Athelia psychrophila]|uniref:Uncharacterized protein n=1 Tax=Athelia psychrophila TaxID=1759441 RepID=A0A167V3F1_9AGAM|nr:hypothetical protein FIBSPDRAFT_1009032 [Fibularhizoctonia sp. CBS 109695]
MLSEPIIVTGIGLGINAVDESKATRLDDVHKKLGIGPVRALFYAITGRLHHPLLQIQDRHPPARAELRARRPRAAHHRPRLLASKDGVHARVPGVDDGQGAEGGEQATDRVGWVDSGG